MTVNSGCNRFVSDSALAIAGYYSLKQELYLLPANHAYGQLGFVERAPFF